MNAAARAVAAAACTLLPACALMTPAKVGRTHRAVITRAPLEVPQARSRTGTLLVLEPTANALYDTRRMAYATGPYEIAFYTRTEWARAPRRMLQPLLVQTLRATHGFGAVEVVPYAGHVAYELRSEIRDLRQDLTGKTPELVLVVHVRLSDDERGRTLLDQDFAARQPMRKRSPAAGAEAANRATQRVLEDVAAATVAAMDRAHAATEASGSGCRPAG